MKTVELIQTAQSNLQKAKLRTSLTILAVFIGTFTLVMTTAITQGVSQYINVQVHAYGESNSLNISPTMKSGLIHPFTLADVSNVKNVPNISTAYPDYTVQIDYVKYKNKQVNSPTFTSLYPDSNPSLAAGTLPPALDTNAVMIPYDALASLGFANPQAAIGKTITLQVSSTFKSTPLKENLRVAAVLINTIHGQPGFISYALMHELYTFQNGTDNGFKSIYATTSQNISSPNLSTIEANLTSKGYVAKSFQDQVSRLNQVITFGQLGTAAFAGISLLVGCICIINTLLMAVLERTQEIGLLKALGMKNKEIFSIFALEAASIGFWGGTIAVGVGLLLGPILNTLLNKAVSNLEGFSLLTYPPLIMISIIIGATLLGFIAGILPAIRAGRLDPIVALRHE